MKHIPDYNDFVSAHMDEQEKQLAERPICEECGEHIQDDDCFEINGCLICPECLDINHRKAVDDYID